MHKLFLFVFAVAISHTVLGQAPSDQPVSELKLNLNDDGSHFLKWTFLNQVWLRYNDSNPGTTVMDERASSTFDIGLRRTRIQFFGQVTDHVSFYTQFGQNNFNFLAGQTANNDGNRKFQVFFHDALGEYKVWKGDEKLKLGAGLTITNGLSRFSQPSIGTIMTMDVPIFAQATVDQIDEFARKLSVYARGQLGKFDYRIALSDPFPITSNGIPTNPLPGPNATFARRGHEKQYQGFFIYNIFEKEPHTTPYMTGTYLGRRKVLNVEAGFISQSKATWSSDNGGVDTKFHDMNLWSVAVFYDAPLDSEKGTAVSAYAGYFNLDYGPNYLRYNGIMNPANGSVNGPAGGHGNAFPMFGSGDVFYGQAGYLFPKDMLGSGMLQAYASMMRAKYDRLSDQMNIYNIGINWLLQGHASKISLDFQLRPVFEVIGSELSRQTNRGQIVLQYQISL